jgi:hypothetical protein
MEGSMKRTILAVALVAIGTLAHTGRSQAAIIETPPLHNGGNRTRCMLANHGDKQIVVSDARILNQNGGVAAVGGVGTVVPANGAATLVEAVVQQGTCRVSGKFVKNRVQVTLCSVSGIPNDGACLEAVTAP